MCRRGENIYKRKDGRWEGRYAKGRKANGALKYGYVYGKSYSIVRRELLMLKSDYQRQCQWQSHYHGTSRQWIQSWLLEEVQERVKLSTFASYQHKLQTYVLPSIGELPLQQVTRDCLQQLIKKWQRQLSPATILVLYRILSKCMKHAVAQQVLLINPCEGLVLPKREVKPVHALTRREQAQLEMAAQQDGVGLPALLALHTGLRMGELAALQWKQIDFEAQTIRITHTYQRVPLPSATSQTQLLYTPAKTASSVRLVPFSKRVKQWLRQWKQTHEGAFIFSRGGKPMEPRLLTYHFQQLRERARLPHIHFHQLRHTFATRCMEITGDVAAISAMLGHASAKTTLDIYTDALMDQRHAVIAAMEQQLG